MEMCMRIPWHSNRILMPFPSSHVEDIATFVHGKLRFHAH